MLYAFLTIVQFPALFGVYNKIVGSPVADVSHPPWCKQAGIETVAHDPSHITTCFMVAVKNGCTMA